MISVQHLVKRYGKKVAVDDLSLRLCAPREVASAVVTTIGVTQPRSVDEHGVPPVRVVPTQLI